VSTPQSFARILYQVSRTQAMINAPNPMGSPPQLHSHDYQIRVSAATFSRIVFEHLYTMEDPGVIEDSLLCGMPGRRAGITEWQGVAGNKVVSLAWDWAELSDGCICMLTVVPPRSNLVLLDALGYDLDCPSSVGLFVARIEWLGWRTTVREALEPSAVARRF